MLPLLAAAVHGTTYQATEAAIQDTESLAQVDAAQANFQIIGDKREHCAALKKDCSEAKCCKTTGYRCRKVRQQKIHVPRHVGMHSTQRD